MTLTSAQRVTQLDGWVELVRLVVGRNNADMTRLEQLEGELRKALAEAKRDAEAYAAVDEHIKKHLGDSDR